MKIELLFIIITFVCLIIFTCYFFKGEVNTLLIGSGFAALFSFLIVIYEDIRKIKKVNE